MNIFMVAVCRTDVFFFSHKGKAINIVNENSWTDGGVASPAPFYWSTNGYGMMWYTFKPGKYDFGADEKGKVKLTHDSPYLDLFYMVSDGAVGVLNDFYQLTVIRCCCPSSVSIRDI